MVIALFFWWYGAGWARVGGRVGSRMHVMLETFSVALLLRTLFDPFRQISAGGVRGPFQVQFRAWADRSFSRVFGAVVRSMFIIIGTIAALGIGLFGLLELIVWPAVPLLPVVGLVLMVVGVKM